MLTSIEMGLPILISAHSAIQHMKQMITILYFKIRQISVKTVPASHQVFLVKTILNKTEVTSVKLVLFKYVMSFETLT